MTIDRIYEEAAGWLVRQRDDAVDWEGFTQWLEADPRHRSAFDELALLDADLDAHATTLSMDTPAFARAVANDAEPFRWKRWAGIGGGALAAALALTVALQPASRELPVQDYQSAPGKRIEVALADGGNVLLAPQSHLKISGNHVSIEGTGYFNIPHKPGRTLTISAGEFQVTDIGTRFSVENEARGINVDVEEGSLSIASRKLASPIALSAGHGLRVDRANRTARTISVDPKRVAGWRSGRLQFDQVPLALVAQDISRYSGRKVTVDLAIADQPFSGVIAIDEGEAPARTLAQILSLDVQDVDGTLRLRPRH